MPESRQKFYLTTPIYYVNARPHIGHAYTTLVADTIARRHRLLGHDTFFLTGTDEHGQKIQRSAAAAGIPPQQFTDELSAEFRNLWARMGLTNDDFIRTTEPRHQQGAQRLFALLHQRGQIYLSSYTGQYSIGEEIFVEGPPGVLGPDGKPTETVTEENFFFRLSEYQLPLLDLIESDTLLIQPESRKNEVLSFLRGPVSQTIAQAAAEPRPERSGAPSISQSHREMGGSESISPSGDALPTEAGSPTACPEPVEGSGSSDVGSTQAETTTLESSDAATKKAAAIGRAALLSAIASSEATPFGAMASGDSAAFAAIDIGQAAEQSAQEAATAGTPDVVILNEVKDPRISSTAAPMQPGAPFISQSHREMSGNANRPPSQNESPQTSPQIAYSALGNPYVPGNLRDLSVSRSSFTWGIPVPEPAASETKQKHVIYVWLDALANYMTAVGYGSNDPEKIEQFKKYWPADVHIMAKEITRQHCIYWPAFLLALNPKLQHNPGEPTPKLSPEEHRAWAEKMLPKAVVAHGWLLFDDSKMSKSKGNIVRTETILDAFGTLCPPAPSPSSLSSAVAPLLSSRSAAEGSAVSPDTAQTPTKKEQDLFAADVLRYFLLREVPFGQDGSFSFEALITRYNADLANGYGNLVSRTLSMTEKYFEGFVPDAKSTHLFERFIKMPSLSPSMIAFGPNDIFASRRDEAYADAPMAWHWAYMNADSLETAFHDALDRYSFSEGLEKLWWAVAQIDGFITKHAPWKVAAMNHPEARPALSEIIYTACEAIRQITALLHPILPSATASVWTQLGLGDIELAAKNGELKNLEWGGLQPGTKLGPLSPIFPRANKGLAQIMTDMESSNAKPAPSKLVDEQTVNTEPASTNTTDPGAGPRTSALNEENPGSQVGGAAAPGPELIKTPPHAESPASAAFATASAASTTPDTPQISIDDFVKIDLRVARILVAERIPKANKLLRLEVDLGYERRQILSGIAEWYTPEELIGRRIVVITNLAPRKMRGLESHGMLLAASAGENAKPILATFTEDIPLGSRLR